MVETSPAVDEASPPSSPKVPRVVEWLASGVAVLLVTIALEVVLSGASQGLWLTLSIIGILAAPVYLFWALGVYRRGRAIRAVCFAAVVCMLFASPVRLSIKGIKAVPVAAHRVDASVSHVTLLGGVLPTWFQLSSRTPPFWFGDGSPGYFLDVSGGIGTLFTRGELNDVSCGEGCGLLRAGEAAPRPDSDTTNYLLAQQGNVFYLWTPGSAVGPYELAPNLSRVSAGYWVLIVLMFGVLGFSALESRRSARGRAVA